jgi:mRNA interferase MazF
MVERNVKRGSIVLIKYPFTDYSEFKLRPAVIISNDFLLDQTDDIICIFISSSIKENLLLSDFIIDITHPSFHLTGLKQRSFFRTHKITTINKSLILRVIGEADSIILDQINKHLKYALGMKD